jgi:hypothetical protein
MIREKVHHTLRFTVWVTISSHCLLGPILFEDTVNSECYVSMLHSTSVPHLLATGLPLQTHWLMQDGSRLHSTNVLLNFLNDTFDSCVISNQFPDHFACGQNWSWNSPGLNP